MKIEERSELLVIDIPQKDFKEMAEDNMDSPMWDWIRNTKRVLDYFSSLSNSVIMRPHTNNFYRPLIFNFINDN